MTSAPMTLSTSRLSQWSELVGENFLPLEFRRTRSADFHGTARITSLGAARVTEVRATPQKVVRTPALANRSESAYVKVLWQLHGEALLEQDGASARLQAGSWSTYDASRPYSLELGADAHFVSLLLPCADGDETPKLVRRLSAAELPTTGCAGIALALLRNMLQAEQARDAVCESLLHQSLVNMLQAALRTELLARVGDSRAGCDRLFEAQSYIERYLHDTTLTPAAVAHALNMSRRSLYNLFARTDDSPCAYLQRRRLERARRALADPLHQARSVSLIAYDHGFADAAHFSRRFHQRFGESPSAFRRRVAAQGAPPT